MKKSDIIVRELHHFNSKFSSVTALRMELINGCKEHVPNTTDFSVGYFEGHQHSKMWLVTNDDLNSMYTKYHNGAVV